MKSQLKKRTEGFTIIEVLIVLAIAGLIMLIVFLAVPALQRNQRNTSKKSDVGRVGSVTTEWVSNNNGQPPNSAVDATAIRGAVGNLAQYDVTTYPTYSNSAAFTLTATAADSAKMVIHANKAGSGVKCPTAITMAAGNSSRQMAVEYVIEIGNNAFELHCQDI
jgi:prepilin-type N-terminal cleavage/methylation domain-containing protein